ncbi:MAG: exosortase C-terminal domain/associated protein EpsI [Planctomycetota bacterium]
MTKHASPYTLVWVALSVVLLGGMAVQQGIYRKPPADAGAYHARVGSAIDDLPYTFGEWIGTDSAVPAAAVRLLRANRVFSRRFMHMSTGQSVQVLIVHCTDSRDLIGHYPPVCYPGNGWKSDGQTPAALGVPGYESIDSTRYEFKQGDQLTERRIAIFNFMVLPDGQIVHDMDAVSTASQDYRRKFFGAAQVQVLVPPDLSLDEQTQLAAQFVELIDPVLREIQSGDL